MEEVEGDGGGRETRGGLESGKMLYIRLYLIHFCLRTRRISLKFWIWTERNISKGKCIGDIIRQSRSLSTLLSLKLLKNEDIFGIFTHALRPSWLLSTHTLSLN